MSNLVLSTIKDIINNEKELIIRRYAGDFEFNEFKKYLNWKRGLLITINLIITIISIILFSLTIYYTIKDFKNISNQINLLISLGLLIFSLNNLYGLHLSKRYLKIEKNLKPLKKIIWNEWQFKDIILNKQIRLNTRYKVQFDSRIENYCFYLILQYSDGSFGWYKITNDPDLNRGIIKRGEEIEINGRKVNPIIEIERANLQQRRKVIINHRTIMDEMLKNDYNLNPIKIVGIRIRSNILNGRTILDNINLKKN